MDEASETEGDRRRRVGGGDGSGSACYLSLAIVLYDAKVEDLGRLTARRLRLMTGMMLYSRPMSELGCDIQEANKSDAVGTRFD